MENPISLKTRGKIYISGVIAAGIGMFIGPLFALLQIESGLSLAVSVLSAVSLVVGILARANLDTTALTAEQLQAVIEKAKNEANAEADADREALIEAAVNARLEKFAADEGPKSEGRRVASE